MQFEMILEFIHAFERSSNFDVSLVQNGYPLCHFSEYDYGPKSYWLESYGKEKGKEKEEDFHAPERKCDCGVVASNGLVPSELGIGYYCGHMVGDDLVSFICL
jgi:hypothetical protein